MHQFSKNLGATLKLLGARRVTRRKFHTGHPQILGAGLRIFGVQGTWGPGIVYPCVKEFQSKRGVQMSQKCNEWRHAVSCSTRRWPARSISWHAPLASFYPPHTRTAVLTFTMAFTYNGVACNIALVGKGVPSVVLKTHIQHYIHTRRFGVYYFLPQVNSFLYIYIYIYIYI